jgi:uncharacterized protein DUF3558
MATPRTWLTAVSMASVSMALAALLTACDGDTAQPRTSTTRGTPAPSTSSSRADRTGQAPPVRNPLDDGAFAAAPCTSLTSAQLSELRLSNTEAVVGDSCAYTDLDPATELAVYVYYFGADNGLGELYDMKADAEGMWTDWATFELDGHPAVRFRDYKSFNVCDLGVGTSGTTYFRVRVQDPADDERDTCGLVTTVGSAVLATVKAAN